MGSKNKLKRFKENETLYNVIQPNRKELENELFPYKGKWCRAIFKNDNPIVLELGCGKGEYTVHLASKNTEQNHIGIDIKGARFWRGAKMALEQGLKNVTFLRIQIELISYCFAPEEVDEIWITFPDPQIKLKRTKHRLTNPEFLSKYKKIIKPKGNIHLKTDSTFLYGYTLGLLERGVGNLIYAHHDIYNNPHAPEQSTAIQTFYEKKFLENEKPITYMQFQLL